MIYLVETPSGELYFSTLPEDVIEESYRKCGDGDFIIAAIDEEDGTSSDALGEFAKNTVDFFSCYGLHLSSMENSTVNEIIDEAKVIGDDFARSVGVALRMANRIECHDMTDTVVWAYEDFDTDSLRAAYAREIFKSLKNGEFMLVSL